MHIDDIFHKSLFHSTKPTNSFSFPDSPEPKDRNRRGSKTTDRTYTVHSQRAQCPKIANRIMKGPLRQTIASSLPIPPGTVHSPCRFPRITNQSSLQRFYEIPSYFARLLSPVFPIKIIIVFSPQFASITDEVFFRVADATKK